MHVDPARLLLVMALLVTAACGARLTDEQVEAALSAGGTPNGQASSSGASGSATATTTAGAGTGAAGATGSAGTGATATPGVEGTGGGAGDPAAVGGSCTPAPSSEVGVTDTEIRIGSVSTISGPVPGLGANGLNGIRAYFNYVNSQGGVCGRRLTLLTGDDRMDVGQNRAVAQSLEPQVLGFVTGLSPVDGGTAAVVDGTNVPVTGLAISNAAVASANVFSPIPIDPSAPGSATEPIWRYFAATRGITKVAIVYPAQADARARALGYVEDIHAAGLAVDGPYEVPVTETNYVSVAQQIENSGADGVVTALEVTGISRLAQALAQVGYTPTVPFYGAQTYGARFLELAEDAANGTALGLQHAIFEDAPNSPIVATFLEWFARTNPGTDPDFFAVMGWAAADMMVQALDAAGPAPTRDATLGFLRGLTVFDAHGIIAPCDPAGKHPSTQFMVVNVQDGRWVREYPPGSGFGGG